MFDMHGIHPLPILIITLKDLLCLVNVLKVSLLFLM